MKPSPGEDPFTQVGCLFAAFIALIGLFVILGMFVAHLVEAWK